ncbi:MAG: InlB B-repeat-containing protein [Bacteroidales bacterium]|jgi:uncharacterized repeat protein (TIGR02543 family)|nr:InlB B-repeat-containing protein [Bacteroidales bacterium]
MKKFSIILTSLAFMIASTAINAQTIRYVRTTGTTPWTDAVNATSWATACSDLQAVINISNAGDEIWVAAGTYKPLHSAQNWTPESPTGVTVIMLDSQVAFVLKEAVKIYGGFPDTGLPIFADRNWTTNTTILSGYFDASPNPSYNACHVVMSVGTSTVPITSATILDGFTITEGRAISGINTMINAYSADGGSGAGIYNYYSSPTLTNLIITDNATHISSGVGYGGGIYNVQSSPILSNVIISNNTAKQGGGIFNAYSSSPTLTNVKIIGNKAMDSGGGIACMQSSATITNAIISGNSAGQSGGGINSPYAATYTLTNVTICGNGAWNANEGGMVCGTSTSLTNCIIWNNGYLSNPTSSATFSHCLVEGINPAGTGNLDGTAPSFNPLFIDQQAPATSSNTTLLGDYRLQIASPLLNIGANAAYLSARGIADFTNETDVAGNPRLYGTYIDLGAYEYFPTYTISLDPNGGVVNPTSVTQFEGYAGGILPIPTRAGYIFVEWNDAQDGSGTSYLSTTIYNDITFYAQWTAIEYEITYILNGGTNNPANPTSYTIESATITLLNPIKLGYTFNDWTEGNTISTGSTGDKTFTAQWIGNTYEISFDAQGGSEVENKSVTFGDEIGELENSTRTSYVFGGWFTEANGTGTEYTATTIYSVTDNITLYAKWTAIEYEITYILNGGTNNPANPTSYTIESATITLLNPTKTDYNFTGWTEGNTIPTGSTGDKTFTAQWTALIGIDVIENSKFSIYPNPASDIITISGISVTEPVEVTITDLLGRIMYRLPFTVNINISNLTKGIYLIQIGDKTTKFIKE